MSLVKAFTAGNGTCDVGSFPANAFGLYDMHGNVWEWCADLWHSNYNNAPNDASIWLAGDELSNRVGRGGSWFNNLGLCRSAFRFRVASDSRNSFQGFRVACSPGISSAWLSARSAKKVF